MVKILPLVNSIFSIFHNIFKGVLLQGPELLTTQSRLLTTLGRKAFENNVGKGENAGNQHFLLFPQCFLPFQTKTAIFGLHLFCRLQMLKILSFGKELTQVFVEKD